MSETCLEKTARFDSPQDRKPLRQSPYVATAAEAMKNYEENRGATWYKDDVDPDDHNGKYAFQRLRQTWFTPKVDSKFTLRQDDKVYAVGSCFARGIKHALKKLNIAVESAAPEFAKLEPAKRGVSGLGFTNNYNTHSILNELRWSLDPEAVFPLESIVQLTKTTWYDPHTNPTLSFVSFEETLSAAR